MANSCFLPGVGFDNKLGGKVEERRKELLLGEIGKP